MLLVRGIIQLKLSGISNFLYINMVNYAINSFLRLYILLHEVLCLFKQQKNNPNNEGIIGDISLTYSVLNQGK